MSAAPQSDRTGYAQAHLYTALTKNIDRTRLCGTVRAADSASFSTNHIIYDIFRFVKSFFRFFSNNPYTAQKQRCISARL